MVGYYLLRMWTLDLRQLLQGTSAETQSKQWGGFAGN